MTLFFIGVGLWDENDLTLKALEVLKNCSNIYAEFYTSKLMGTTLSRLEERLGQPIKLVKREMVESNPEVILTTAHDSDIALLVAGDPLAATTHIDLRLRAHAAEITTQVIHGVSVFSVIPGLLGLQHYKFGRTTTLGYPDGNYFPTSPYEVVRENLGRGLHTLVLLDIQADRGRYMTAKEALEILAQLEERIGTGVFHPQRLICVVAHAGSMDPLVLADAFSVLRGRKFGPPMHSLVIPGNLHFIEEEALIAFAHAPPEIIEVHKAVEKR